MRAAQILRLAAELLTPANWTQGMSARDSKGGPKTARHPEATRWCAEGALLKVWGNIDDTYTEATAALDRACGMPYVKFNDTPGRKAEDVKKAMLRAAQKLEPVT